jgi:methylglutaconyl-CoA hydratase
VATESGRFCLSETRIGLIPAVISPYVIRAIGERRARRYLLTAEPFSSQEALDFGLVHEVVIDAAQLESAGKRYINALLNNGPQAIGAAKALIAAVSHQPIDQTLIADTTRRIAEIRAGSEAQEGLSAFLEKREPSWINSTKE